MHVNYAHSVSAPVYRPYTKRDLRQGSIVMCGWLVSKARQMLSPHHFHCTVRYTLRLLAGKMPGPG